MNIADASTQGAILRTKDFVREHENWEGADSFISITGEYNTPERFTLNSLDLKLVLDRLATLELAVRNASDALAAVKVED